MYAWPRGMSLWIVSWMLIGHPPPAGAQAAKESIHPGSGTLALRVTPEGSSVLVLDESGHVLRAIDAGDRATVLGSGGHFALVTRNVRGTTREVEIRDVNGATAGRFRIPIPMDVSVAKRIVATYPRAEHGIGTRYEVAFRDVSGAPLTSYARPDLTMLGLERYANDHWA